MIQFTTSVWMIQSFGKTGLVLKFSSFLKESSANSDLTLLLYDFRRPVIWHTSYMDHFYDNFAFFLKLESSSPHLLQLHGKEQPTHSSKFQEWKSYGLEMGEQMMTEFVFFGELSLLQNEVFCWQRHDCMRNSRAQFVVILEYTVWFSGRWTRTKLNFIMLLSFIVSYICGWIGNRNVIRVCATRNRSWDVTFSAVLF